MSTLPLTALLDELSAEIVLADAASPDSLRNLGQLLARIEGAAAESGHGTISARSREAADRVEALDPAEEPELLALLEWLGELATELLEEVRADVSPAAEAPDSELDGILEEFLGAQTTNLEELERAVLEIERGEDVEGLEELRRRLHTLKGEAGVLSLDRVAALAHGLEDALAARPARELVDVLLAAIDWLRNHFESGADATAAPFDLEGALTERPARVPHEATEEERAFQPHSLIDDPLLGEFVAESREHLEEVDNQLLILEKSQDDPEAVNAVFRAFHTIKGLASFLEIESVRLVAHESETFLDRARSGEVELTGRALELVFEANDGLKVLIEAVDEALGSGGELSPDKALLALLGRLRAAQVRDEVLPPRAPEPAKEPEPSQRDAIDAAPTANPGPESASAAPPRSGARSEPSGPAKPQPQTHETIKVDAGRLDELVDMIGELVIAEAMVTQSDEIDCKGTSRLAAHLSHLDKITRELQELAMSLRMVPIRSTFRRMARIARDVANKLGKPICFETHGEDTELDKTVIDAIGDPLVHMVRNAVDHGIEKDREERIAAGKPPEGRLRLRAFHEGGCIHVEIEDDGGGLDREKLLRRARERGIVADGESLTDSEVFDLVFAPGFSTSEQVTDVSGRGVGMDVVRRSIESLRGRVEIRSELGRGTVFSIRLPLTLAIIDGMVVSVAGQRYVLPTASIDRMLRVDTVSGATVFGSAQVLNLEDGLVPVFQLRQLFGAEGDSPDPRAGAAVVVEYDASRVAFVVDELLGQQQIVIKPLGPALAGTPGIAGGAIMPDGQVGLILDVAGLTALTSRPAPTSSGR